MTQEHRAAEAEPANPAELAQYVHDLTTELAALARAAKLDGLAHFLEMASHEARSVAAELRSASPKR